MYLSRLTLAGAVLALTGCATWGAETLRNVERSQSDLRRIAMASLPLGPREGSESQQGYFSKYFVAHGSKFVAAPEVGQRRYAHILFRGDRRPYTIEIMVFVEEGSPTKGYRELGTDSRIAKIIRRRFVELLNKRREEIDIIDAFRAF